MRARGNQGAPVVAAWAGRPLHRPKRNVVHCHGQKGWGACPEWLMCMPSLGVCVCACLSFHHLRLRWERATAWLVNVLKQLWASEPRSQSI